MMERGSLTGARQVFCSTTGPRSGRKCEASCASSSRFPPAAFSCTPSFSCGLALSWLVVRAVCAGDDVWLGQDDLAANLASPVKKSKPKSEKPEPSEEEAESEGEGSESE
eukprot:372443-Rhodomonas_salina.1